MLKIEKTIFLTNYYIDELTQRRVQKGLIKLLILKIGLFPCPYKPSWAKAFVCNDTLRFRCGLNLYQRFMLELTRKKDEKLLILSMLNYLMKIPTGKITLI